MKRVFNLLLAVLAIFGIACNRNDEGNSDNDNNDPLTLEIEISSVTWDSAVVLIHPSNYDDSFYFDIIEKAAYDQYESDKTSTTFAGELNLSHICSR